MSRNLSVPYKSQWDADGGGTRNDCGPASVAMILNYYGKKVTTDDVYKATGADSGLISWPQLQKAITSFGYKSTLERNQNLARIKSLIDQDIPVLLVGHYGSLKSTQDKNYKGGHFMLVVGYHNDGFFVNDPNFKGNLRQDGDHHNYTTAEIEAFWKDTVKDGNQAYSLLWVERNGEPVADCLLPNTDANRRLYESLIGAAEKINKLAKYLGLGENADGVGYERFEQAFADEKKRIEDLQWDNNGLKESVKEHLSQKKVLDAALKAADDSIDGLKKELTRTRETLIVCEKELVKKEEGIPDPRQEIKRFASALIVEEFFNRLTQPIKEFIKEVKK